MQITFRDCYDVCIYGAYKFQQFFYFIVLIRRGKWSEYAYESLYWTATRAAFWYVQWHNGYSIFPINDILCHTKKHREISAIQ